MTDTLLHAQFTNDGLIIAMWKFGLDTYEIAKPLHVHESIIVNRLMHIRNVAKMEIQHENPFARPHFPTQQNEPG